MLLSLVLLLLPLATWATGAVVSIVVVTSTVGSRACSDVADVVAATVAASVSVAVADEMPLSLSACKFKDCNIIYCTLACFYLLQLLCCPVH